MVSVSVVIPAKNEEGNVSRLVEEIHAALDGQFVYEIIYINDGSTDCTLEIIRQLQAEDPVLKVWTHQPGAGQSRAMFHGVLLAEYSIVATLDADGQNDPADIPAMVERLVRLNSGSTDKESGTRSPPFLFDSPGVKTGLIAGFRKNRRDPWLKRASGRVANVIRAWVLNDRTPDTGCGLKVFYRDIFLRLPYFDHMHRFLPALFRRLGYEVAIHEVNHRSRHTGASNYGIHDRLWVGIVDILGVIWLQRRCRAVKLVQNNIKGHN